MAAGRGDVLGFDIWRVTWRQSGFVFSLLQTPGTGLDRLRGGGLGITSPGRDRSDIIMNDIQQGLKENIQSTEKEI